MAIALETVGERIVKSNYDILNKNYEEITFNLNFKIKSDKLLLRYYESMNQSLN